MGNVNRVLEAHSCEFGDVPITFTSPSSSDRPKVYLSDCKTILSFRPNVNSTLSLPIDCVVTKDRSRRHKACIRLKIQATVNSQVIIGFGRAGSPGNSSFFNGTYVNVTLGRIISDNQVLPDIALPICTNGGEVRCCIDMFDGVVQYSVTNPGCPSSVKMNLSLGENIPNEITPMVGIFGSGNGGVSIEILPLRQPVSSPSELLSDVCFDNSSTFGPIKTSSDGLVASRSNVVSNCCILMNQVLRTGVHTWTLKVLKDFGSSVCLGLARYPLNISQEYANTRRQIYLHDDLMLWRSYKGLLYAGGRQLGHSLEPIGWNNGETVLVKFLLDLNVGELEVIRNGKSLGVAFKEVKGPVCPAVVFYASYDKEVQIIDYRKGISVADVSERSLEPPVIKPIPVPVQVPACTPQVPAPSTSSDSKRPITTRSNSYPNPSSTSPMRPQPTAVFDVTSKRGPVTVSEDGLTLTRAETDDGNAYCLLDKVLCRRGVYRWSFRIDLDKGASTCVGITTEPVDMCPADHIFHSKSMWVCRSFQGSLFLNGKKLQKDFDQFWADGSKVELTLDLENAVLQYSINNTDQGVAFCNLNGEYRPVVAFYSKLEKKVTLLKFETLSERRRQVSASEDINDLSVQIDSATIEEPDINNPLKASDHSDVCLVCSIRDNNVGILPCKHVVYCPVHAEQAEKCIVCGAKISGVWNVFS